MGACEPSRRPRLLTALALACALAAAACGRGAAPPAGTAARADRGLASETEEITGTVPRDETLAGLLRAYLPADRAEEAVQLISRSMDPRTLRAGRPFALTRTLDGWLREFRCELDADRYLRVQPRSADAPRDLSAEAAALCEKAGFGAGDAGLYDRPRRGRPTVYCSGPLFCAGEIVIMGRIAAALEGAGYAAFLPHRGGVEAFVVNQVEISLMRFEPFLDGTLDQCLAEKITPITAGEKYSSATIDGAAIPSTVRSR